MNSNEHKRLAQLNTAMYSSFVSPENCKLLAQAGVKMFHPLYEWVAIADVAHIRCFLYDPDGYYHKAYPIIDETNKQLKVTAYTVGMLEQMLPPYMICKTGIGIYEIMCEEFYEVKQVRSERLPDAMALMVLALLKKEAISANDVNKLLNH
jgi:hypothetical protein